jgi:hypothetical protein
MCIPDHAGPQRAAATTTGWLQYQAPASPLSLSTNALQPKEPAASEYTRYEGSGRGEKEVPLHTCRKQPHQVISALAAAVSLM